MPQLPKAFISYSHKDASYKEELLTHMQPFVKLKKLEYWADNKLRVGQKWYDEIHDALRSCNAAVLLVSPNFLASDFIMTRELPILLEAYRNGELQLYWVCLSTCGYSLIDELKNTEACHKLHQLMGQMSQVERDQVWYKICDTLQHQEMLPRRELTAVVPEASPERPRPRPAISKLSAVLGDVVECDADAIVFSASREFKGLSAVEALVHRKGGPRLVEELRAWGCCEVGDVAVTEGHGLRAGTVIHAVGPTWYGGNRNEESKLRDCYRRALEAAAQRDCRSIAFTSISTGNKRFPREQAVRIAVQEIGQHLQAASTPLDVTVVCTDPETLKAYQIAIEEQARDQSWLRR